MQTWVLVLVIIALLVDHVDIESRYGTIHVMSFYRLAVLIICCIWG